MQAAGANQVQQGALEAVDNLPSAGVSSHVRRKAVRFGYNVVVLCAVAPVIGAYCLTKPEAVRHMIIESDKTYMMLAGFGVALLSAAAKAISERVCTRPGGFIFERVCTMLDAYERQAAKNDVRDRSDEGR
ncbi:hypothetical protein [Endozoicomonas sp. ONNA2]|uniref:hypothetical protein n=1 Tax=Endozoicomonas sp. ONNA2 TaxID=2828741 RepID=UPI002148207C|nr:hypothetical protein [Endozoicomonas sp. ONNA2]